jgi:hypothetical protein
MLNLSLLGQFWLFSSDSYTKSQNDVISKVAKEIHICNDISLVVEF